MQSTMPSASPTRDSTLDRSILSEKTSISIEGLICLSFSSAVSIFSLILVKRLKLFAESDIVLFDKIDMPVGLKGFLKKIVAVLA